MYAALYKSYSVFSSALVVLCVGTNVEQAKKLLQNSGLAITPADDFQDVAQKAVASLPGQ